MVRNFKRSRMDLNCGNFYALFSMDVIADVLEHDDFCWQEALLIPVSAGLYSLYDIPEKDDILDTYNDLIEFSEVMGDTDIHELYDDLYWAGVEYICEDD